MSAVDKLLKIALDEVGYLEKETNSNLDNKTANAGDENYTKYARDMDVIPNFYNGKKNGYAWCFTEDTLILTDCGYKNIQDVKVGDRVLNAYGDRFNTITNTSYHDADVIDVRVYGALPFSVTPDHPFLSQKRKDKNHRKKGYKEWGFNEIGSLNVKDVVSVPQSPVLHENGLSYDELWTLGYYVGDGWKTRDTYFVCGNEAKSIEITKHIDCSKDKNYKSRTCYEYRLHKTDHELLFDILADCGDHAINKRVPAYVLFGSTESKRAFLDGYLAADGCVVDGKYRCNSISRELVTGISRLLLDLQICCSVVMQKRQAQGKIFDTRLNTYRTFNQQEYIYHCGINDNNDVAHSICIFGDKKTLVPIRKKSLETHVDTVYTLTTDGDHTYTANNIGVHNCDVFVDWCFKEAFGWEMALKLINQPTKSLGAGCNYSADYYKAMGRFYSTPKIGDQIFFKNSKGQVTHTGLVYDVDSSKVYTVEGNTSGASGVVANGGGVLKKSYSRSYSNIYGYGRPKYELVDSSYSVTDTTSTTVKRDTVSITVDKLKKGDKGSSVKTLQQLLIAKGYSCGSAGADGDFGNGTYNAVKKFQKENNLAADGVVGKDTWTKLLN